MRLFAAGGPVVHVAIPGSPEMDFVRPPYSKRDPAFFPRVADPFA